MHPTVHRFRVRRYDGPRADLLGVHAAEPVRFRFLYESAGAAGARGRWDLLAACSGEALALTPDGTLGGRAGGASGFLDALDRWYADEGGVPPGQASTDADGTGPSLPFVGGWCLYLGYELAAEVEPRLRLPRGERIVAYAERVRAAVLHDRAAGTTWLVAETGAEGELDALDAALRRHPVEHAPTALPPAPLALVEDPPAAYLDAVRAALAHVAAGDVYQANLSRAWRGRLPAGIAPPELYERLRRANPGPFAGVAHLPDGTVLSTSPERLVECRGGIVSTRPIAGTRPRVGDDASTVAELRANAKERAEHVMLLDLERNDLGRVCVAGSVVVDELMTVETYAHVHHIVSNVRGRLRADVTPGTVVRALFPGGTITGCPKVRCMEIVAALEREARGAYTGSLGYLSLDGALDLNILIRTATVVGDAIEVRAGAGIVADSDPDRELEETRAKARGLLRGLAGEGR